MSNTNSYSDSSEHFNEQKIRELYLIKNNSTNEIDKISDNELFDILKSNNNSENNTSLQNIFNPFPSLYAIRYNNSFTKNINAIEKKNKYLFKIKKILRGRKSKRDLNKKEHNKYDLDNILTKIQVHFFNFIINVSNDAIETILGKKNTFFYKFKKIDYNIKKKVNHGFITQLKSYTIKDILNKRISIKHSKIEDKNLNQKIYKIVCKLSKWLENFFNMNFLVLFNFYYSKEEPLKVIEYDGEKISLSDKTESFYYLLEKNKDYKKQLSDAAKIVYFNGYDSLINKNSFNIIKK